MLPNSQCEHCSSLLWVSLSLNTLKQNTRDEGAKPQGSPDADQGADTAAVAEKSVGFHERHKHAFGPEQISEKFQV